MILKIQYSKTMYVVFGFTFHKKCSYCTIFCTDKRLASNNDFPLNPEQYESFKNYRLIRLIQTLNLFQGRVIGAPFFSVNFADFWLADQMNSFVNALLDFQFLTCFYYYNGDWQNAGGNNIPLKQHPVVIIFNFRHIRMYGEKFLHTTPYKLFTSLVQICPVSQTLL